MTELFSSLERATLVPDPYPHLVVEGALPADVASTLLAEMPPVQVLAEDKDVGSNVRFALPSPLAIKDPRISARWKEALQACLDSLPLLLRQTLTLMRSHLLHLYPDFEIRFGPIDALEPIPRYQADRQRHQVGMDAQMVVNSPPLTGGTTVRGPHLDQSDKLISGLLYLRAPDDDSVGGELELYEPAVEDVLFNQSNETPRDAVRTVRTYPYRHNLLILPINSPRALHGVSSRGQTTKPRYHLHLVGELVAPLFPLRRSESMPVSGATRT